MGVGAAGFGAPGWVPLLALAVQRRQKGRSPCARLRLLPWARQATRGVWVPQLCNKPLGVCTLRNLMPQGSGGPVSWGVGAWRAAQTAVFGLWLWRPARGSGLDCVRACPSPVPTPWSLRTKALNWRFLDNAVGWRVCREGGPCPILSPFVRVPDWGRRAFLPVVDPHPSLPGWKPAPHPEHSHQFQIVLQRSISPSPAPFPGIPQSCSPKP